MDEGHKFLLEEEAAEGPRRRRRERDAAILQSIIRDKIATETWDQRDLLLAQADTQGISDREMEEAEEIQFGELCDDMAQGIA